MYDTHEEIKTLLNKLESILFEEIDSAINHEIDDRFEKFKVICMARIEGIEKTLADVKKILGE